MKKTAERETLKNTPGYSGREKHGLNPSDKRYIYRNADGRFVSRPDGHSSKYSRNFHIISSTPDRLNRRDLVAGTFISHNEPILIVPPVEEAPDFTEADKDWIDKIDRTQLSWDEW